MCSADKQTDTHTQHPLLLFDPMHSWITLCAGFSSLILMSTLTINHMLIETLGESQWFSPHFSSISFCFCSSSSFNILYTLSACSVRACNCAVSFYNLLIATLVSLPVAVSHQPVSLLYSCLYYHVDAVHVN